MVDDTPTNRVILSKLLLGEGYEVSEAEDGSAAIAIALTWQPAVILLDIMMPGMDGYAACKKLRAKPETATIPIIFLSALDAPFDKVYAFQHGAADYITKPFQAEEVLARVRHQINLQTAKQEQERLHAELESQVQAQDQQLKLANRQLIEESLTDSLTRLPNRLAFVEQLRKAIAYGQTHPEGRFSVVYLDCDRFKRINDSLGHQAGDRLLQGIAHRLYKVQSTQGRIDTVARFGGDEFALLVTDISGRNDAVVVVESILEAFAEPFTLMGHEIFVEASIGLACGHSSCSAERLLREADVAMYQAKGNASKYCWFESDMHSQAVHLLQLETDLRLALERKEFELYYQPIVDLYRLEVVGFEALVRWHHPTKGLIAPSDFIGFAEDNGLILLLGEQVLQMACAELARWEKSGVIGPKITVSVNIAAQQLLQPDILERIQAVIESLGVATHRLRLELTERSIINNHAFVDGVLKALQNRNIHLSIDDFGTGYSALSYLHTLPVNCLKVDRSFVMPITDELDSLGVVPLIVNIARTMGMQVIAEGIENVTQLKQLQQLGCGYGQGYLFKEAVPAEAAIALLSRPIDQWNDYDLKTKS